MNIEDQAREWRILYEQRRELNRQSAELTKQMNRLGGQLGAALTGHGLSSARTKYGTPVLTTQRVGRAKDWQAIGEWIVETSSPHILQKRVNDTAVIDITDTGVKIPGMEIVEFDKVTVTAPQ